MNKNLIINKNNSIGNVEDVFLNKFDLTWLKTPEENELGHRAEYSIIPTDKGIDDGTVIYKFSDNGFRCDDFTNNHSGYHILFAGCSQTEGIGGNIETVWSHMLHNQLSANNHVDGFFSIARSGWGWQKIIANFMVYTNKFGFPDFLFILLPNIGRFWEWDSEEGRWYYVQRYPNGHGAGTKAQNPNKFQMFDLSIEEHRKLFMDFTVGWKLFEKYCEANGVKMLWSSWDYLENINYKNFNAFDNYIHMTIEDLSNFIADVRPDGKLNKDDLKRRDGHDGVLSHQFWNEIFLQEIKKRGWLNA